MRSSSRDVSELNDEFAATVGEFETVEELREAVAEDVLRRKALQTRTEVFNEIIEEIVKTSEVQVPETMISTELDDQIAQLRTRLAQQGLEFGEYLASNDQTEAGLREELSEAAENRVRNTLVLQEVAKAEGLEVTEEDVDAEIEKLVGDRPNPEQLRTLYRSDYFRGMLENEINDRKLMELVVNLATSGQGAITGAGAALLEADDAPPVAEEVELDEAEDGAEIAAESVDVAATETAEPEATVDQELAEDEPADEAELKAEADDDESPDDESADEDDDEAKAEPNDDAEDDDLEPEEDEKSS